MRLWHEKLIPLLPRQQLLGQHRELAALRGNGWGKKHATVNYVFKYSPAMLYFYHALIMLEMQERGYTIRNMNWFTPTYRGLNCNPWQSDEELYVNDIKREENETIYPEHNDEYLQECLENLANKGVKMEILREKIK